MKALPETGVIRSTIEDVKHTVYWPSPSGNDQPKNKGAGGPDHRSFLPNDIFQRYDRLLVSFYLRERVGGIYPSLRAPFRPKSLFNFIIIKKREIREGSRKREEKKTVSRGVVEMDNRDVIGEINPSAALVEEEYSFPWQRYDPFTSSRSAF